MSDALLGTYSPEAVVLVLSNSEFVHTVSGFADGTFITVTRQTPASELYVGADLSAGRVKRRNKSSNIDVTLHQFSPSNTVLQAIQRADEEDNGNKYVFAMTLKDLSGQTLFSASQAFIAKVPDTTFATTAETRAWTISAVSLQSTVGGNTPMDEAAVSVLSVLGVDVDEKWKA
jgi:hypothetical protein